MMVNSPPQRTYGSIPKTNERSQARNMVRKPSFRVNGCAVRTKMKGKAPTIEVMMKLMSRGVNAESIPSDIDIIKDMNMKRALTSSALPTLVDIAFTLIIVHCFVPHEVPLRDA
jgi:hypothetical protein